MREYIFGYGSLINRGSLIQTLGPEEFGEIVPGRIDGFQRSWSNRVEALGRTGLSVRPRAGASINGVAIEIREGYLEALDRRETGYGRLAVAEQDLVAGRLWLYAVPDPRPPTPDYPVAISYLECVLAGCLAESEAFALEFIRSTRSWDAPLWNDRDKPQYMRRTALDAEARRRIDALLIDNLPDHVTRPLRPA